MSSIQAIHRKICSIASTQKITRAMEMVAASKMRKAKARMLAARTYAEQLHRIVYHVISTQEETSPYLKKDPAVGRTGMILVMSDRGLCGGLNTNLFKILLEAENPPDALAWIGSRAAGFVKRLDCEVITPLTSVGDQPQFQNLKVVIKILLTRYQLRTLDRITVISNRFINTMTQKPLSLSLLPVTAPESRKIEHNYWDYLYEPNVSALLPELINRYLESQLYRAVTENLACEQAARMVAMKNATENADELISHLHKTYHKARQASITQELSEIVSGAEVL